MSIHSDLSVGEIHPVFNWVWADETVRLAQTVTVEDINKAGLVEDTDAMYTLKNITPTWTPIAGSVVVNIDDLGDVTITAPTTGQVLTYDGANWINDTGSAVLALNDLSDVAISGALDDEVLTFSGGSWVNSVIPNSAIEDLSDVVITSPTSGQTLTYDGADWINTSTSSGNSHVVSDAITNAVSNAVTISHNTSGVVVDGFGTGIEILGDTSSATDEHMGGIEYIWDDEANNTSSVEIHAYSEGDKATVGHFTPALNHTPGASRGAGTIDLQTSRTSSANVASGENSGLFGGNDNRVDSPNSVVIGGNEGYVQGVSDNGVIMGGTLGVLSDSPRSAIIAGDSIELSNAPYSIGLAGLYGQIVDSTTCIVGGDNSSIDTSDNAILLNGDNNAIDGSNFSTIINGGFCQINNGSQGLIGGGADNDITSLGSGNTILNGSGNQISDSDHVPSNATIMGEEGLAIRYGEVVQSSGYFAAVGDVQKSSMVVRYEGSITTGGSAVRLSLDGGISKMVEIREGVSFTFHILVNGTTSGNAERYSYVVEGSGYGAGGGDTVIDYYNTTTLFETAANHTIYLNTAADSLFVRVSRIAGTSATIMRWAAHITLLEVSFP